MQKFALHPHQHEIQKFSNSLKCGTDGNHSGEKVDHDLRCQCEDMIF